MTNEAQTGEQMRPIATAAWLLILQTLLSLLSSLVGGIGGYAIHLLSFALPIALFVLLSRRMGIALPQPPTAAGVRRVLPLLPLFLVSTAFLSAATAAVMHALDLPITGGAAEGNGVFLDLFTDCALPALLEEGLVRFAVLSLLLLWDKRQAVWVSALLFALLHASVYQLPYAFVGGLFLALATVVGGSPVYAVLFHFINNLVSLLLQYLALWLPAYATAITLSFWFVAFAAAAWGLIVLWRRGSFQPTKADRTPTDWRALFLSPLTLWAPMMLCFTLL